MPRISTQPLADQPLGALPSADDRRPEQRHWPPAGAGRQVHTFHTEARTKLAPPPCRTPPGQSAGTRQAHPGDGSLPRFRCHLRMLSTRHQWIACARLLGPHLTRSRRAFSATLSTSALDRRTLRWFAASPCRAAAEDRQPNGPAPPSSMQHRITQSDLLHRASWLRFVLTLNRTSLSCRATWRTRSSSLGTLFPALSPGRVLPVAFPLGDPLSSPTSAAPPGALFGSFAGTTGSVAVGTPVTRRPPRRSPHARLTHGAPALGSGVKATVGPGVHDARAG